MLFERELVQEMELTDDEDFLELVEAETWPRAPRNFRQRENQFLKWNNTEFRERFRLSKETVSFLIEEVSIEISCLKNHYVALSADDMVLLTLRYLATGTILQVVGDFIHVDKATASRVITKVIRSIAGLYQQFITMPSTPEELNNVKQGFFAISRFPKCIGALDCTHIKIISPGGQDAEIYRNRKLFFSFNVQAVCDSNLKIQDIVCRWFGSAHDSTIFKNSRLRARIENGEFGEDSVLLGDSGYAVKKYLITPLQNPRTRAEHLFSESQIRTRNPIERCFGVIKRRFPVLALGIRLSIQKVEAIVVACSVLHNIACIMNEPELEVDEEIEAAIEFANGINLDLDPERGDVRVNINNIARLNLINQYFQRLL